MRGMIWCHFQGPCGALMPCDEADGAICKITWGMWGITWGLAMACRPHQRVSPGAFKTCDSSHGAHAHDHIGARGGSCGGWPGQARLVNGCPLEPSRPCDSSHGTHAHDHMGARGGSRGGWPGQARLVNGCPGKDEGKAGVQQILQLIQIHNNVHIGVCLDTVFRLQQKQS
jgi:hypothetical protein